MCLRFGFPYYNVILFCSFSGFMLDDFFEYLLVILWGNYLTGWTLRGGFILNAENEDGVKKPKGLPSK